MRAFIVLLCHVVQWPIVYDNRETIIMCRLLMKLVVNNEKLLASVSMWLIAGWRSVS